jgi:hypothetical protein
LIHRNDNFFPQYMYNLVYIPSGLEMIIRYFSFLVVPLCPYHDYKVAAH